MLEPGEACFVRSPRWTACAPASACGLERFVTAFMEEAWLAFPRLYERISWSERRARRYDPVERGW
ncbi:protein of unknown function [Nitrospira defluvii]|uniref:Uncharacterized protein n=1 Tax=Nitrospira defluvii TaxID=330214 RepID=D8PHH6_9BACT|nr:protein of unknown function [Nitrospira defluvii]